MRAVFVRLTGFDADMSRLGFTDADQQSLESVLMADFERGPVMAGTGGLRKVRFAPAALARGKRGGCRVCYVWFPEDAIVLLVLAFGKNEQANLTARQKVAVKAVVESTRAYLAGRRRSDA